jgi:hypothetical protein
MKTFGKIIVVILCGIGALGVLGMITIAFEDNNSKVKKPTIAEQIQILNNKCPIQLENDVVLLKVDYKEKTNTMIFGYELSLIDKDVLSKADISNMKRISQAMLPGLLERYRKQYNEYDITAIFVYFDKNHNFLFRVIS